MVDEYYSLWDNLKKLPAYRNSFLLSEIWRKIVIQWSILEKNTLGEQSIRSIDSISANVAEGYGRYGCKDKIKFYPYARGSLL